MDLLIRSQDKSCLRKLRQAIWISYSELDNWCIECDYDTIGRYKTKARALEVLDEIQSKLQDKFLCKPIALLKPVDVLKQEHELYDKYKKDFIMQPSTMDIEPINCDNVIYEMPKE